MCSDEEEIETIDLDETEDAWYPDFDALAKAEKEIFGKRTF